MRQIKIFPNKLRPQSFVAFGEKWIKENNYCVPCALSVLLDKPFDDVNSWLKKRGYRKTDRSGTYTDWMPMNQLGLEGTSLKGMSVNKFAALGLPGTYLIRVTRHVLTFKNGIIYDTRDSSKCRVRQVWKQIEKNKIPSDLVSVAVPTLSTLIAKRAREAPAKPFKCSTGDKKQTIINVFEKYMENGWEPNIKQIAVDSHASYIYTRWVLKHL